jgi:hypothetical protein
MPLFLGLVGLVLALWGLNVVSKVDPKVGARVFKAAGGILSIAFAAFLFLRGELAVALPIGAFGLGLLGWLPFGPAGFSQRVKKTGGATSHVRAAYLEMELDHDSGAMRGRVVAGRHQGMALDRLDVATLIGLLSEIDEESRALLMAYLDRREPRWREHAQGDAGAGRAAASTGKMTEQEAYQILGLQPGAGADAISAAHRALMKKFHPDQGGTNYLAARINEAKEILLRRHR